MNKIKYISIDEMEQITQNILVDYGIVLDAKAIEPIPIEEIIEFHYDLDILWDRIDHFDEEGLVMAAIVPTKRQIILNESCKDLFLEKMGTMYFTLAHELGHWVLHADKYEGLMLKCSPFYCRSYNKKPAVEIQADMFAGCLLMPKPVISRVIKQYKWQGSIHMPHLYDIAELFQVSISALKVRLEQLNLLYIDENGEISYAKDAMHEQLTLDI